VHDFQCAPHWPCFGWKICGFGRVADLEFSKSGPDGWTDVYYEDVGVTGDRKWSLRVQQLHEDSSGLVFGFAERGAIRQGLDFIREKVVGISMAHSSYI